MKTFCSILSLSLLLGVGCASPSLQTSVEHVKLSRVDWVVENLPTSYWSNYSGNDHLFYDFWISYEGNLSAADLSQVKVYFPDGDRYWTVYDANDSTTAGWLDPTHHRIGGWGRWWASQDGCWLPLGSLTASLKYKDGAVVSLSFQTREPGLLVAGGADYVGSEENKERGGSTPAIALPRPKVTSAVLSSGQLTVQFQGSDSRNFNGELELCDANGDHLAWSAPFRDGTSGVNCSWLNGGTGLVASGSNTVVLTAANLIPKSGTSADSVLPLTKTCLVIVTDGDQYVKTTGRYDNYDYASMAERTTVTP